MDKDFFEYKNNFNTNREIKSNLVYGIKQREAIKFTIAIPTYKRSILLESALRSAINQTASVEYEVIVIDNDSEGSGNINFIHL